MNPPNQELGRRLSEARKRAGLTQAEVARRLSMRRPSISEIEHGQRPVRVQELKAMARLYRADFSFLMHGAGSKDGQLVRLVADELAHLRDEDLDRLTRAIGIVKARRLGTASCSGS